MRWLYSVIPNFAISLLLYLLIMRFITLIFDYEREIQKTRTLLAKPFLFKIKEKFLGREGDNFANATMEVFKATKYNYFTTTILFFIEYPLLLGIFFTLYHPISVLFPTLRNFIPEMSEIASGVVTGGIEEINIIKAIRISPELFADFDISGILSMKTSILGIDVLETAKWGEITMILPVLTVLYYLYVIFRTILPVIKKERKLKDVVVMLALYIIIGCSITASSFSLPLVFYCYLVICIPVGVIANKIISHIVAKRKLPWIKEQNAVCQEILKKYEIEEYVSAIKEERKDVVNE